MDPLFLMELVGFRATSGNQVVRAIELGVDGLTVGWHYMPSQQDVTELEAFVVKKLGPNGIVATHLAGVGDVGLQKSREAYAFWKKTGKVR